MLERIVATGSLVVRAAGGTRAGEMATHRLLPSEDVDPAALLAPHVARTAAACAGRRVVAAQDTSEINFDRRRKPAAGLGPAGNTGIRGFFVHPVVATDAGGEAVPGVAAQRASGTTWGRASGRGPRRRRPAIAAFPSTRRRAIQEHAGPVRPGHAHARAGRGA